MIESKGLNSNGALNINPQLKPHIEKPDLSTRVIIIEKSIMMDNTNNKIPMYFWSKHNLDKLTWYAKPLSRI